MGPNRRRQSEWTFVLHACRPPSNARAEGRLHHQCSLMGRPHRLESDWACLQRDETCSSGTHALLQHGRMSKWPSCMLPLSSRGRDAYHEEAASSPERGSHGQDVAAEDIGRTIAFV